MLKEKFYSQEITGRYDVDTFFPEPRDKMTSKTPMHTVGVQHKLKYSSISAASCFTIMWRKQTQNQYKK